MVDRTTAKLGAGWLVTRAAEGGLDLQVAPRGRGCIVAGAAVVAVGWTGGALAALATRRDLPLGASPTLTLTLSLVLVGFALWCAFGAEVWHVAPNQLEHGVGIGSVRYTRRFRDAELEIVRRQDQYGRPYYRLYLVVGAERHFLFERNPPELSALAELVAHETGWRWRERV